MCKFCDPSFREIPSNMTVQMDKHGDTYWLYYYIDGKEYGFVINYCPICGRKLTEEDR